MSMCFRTLPGRLSSLVNGSGGRKLPSKLDRTQLQKNVESSGFLKQFLGTQRTLSVRANTVGKSVPFAACAFPLNLSLAYLNVHNQRNEKARRYADDESKNTTMYWVQSPRRLPKSRKLDVALLKSRKHVAPIGITPSNIKIFPISQSVVGNDKDNSFLDSNRTIPLENLHSNSETNMDKSILFTSNGTSLHSNSETNMDKSILFTSDGTSALKTSSQQPQKNEGKPSQEQLQSIVDCLSQDLPKLFVKPQNFSIYTKDLIFINNIRGVTTRGLMNYARQIILLRVIGHMRFAHVKFDIIKITMHPENDTVQIRWRIRGVSGWKVISMFWKYKIWKIQEAINTNQEVWYDGFSTFYVNADGKVCKHIADKMMPDQDTITKKENLRIEPKLALFTGLASFFSNNDDSLN